MKTTLSKIRTLVAMSISYDGNHFTAMYLFHSLKVFIYILNSLYLGSMLLFRQILLKTMEHGLFFLIVIFQVLLFFLCRDPGGKEIVPYLLPKSFRPYTTTVEYLQYGVVSLPPGSGYKKNNKIPEKLRLEL